MYSLVASSLFSETSNTGKVVDSLYEPVTSAEVRVSRSGVPDLIADVETDENGTFKLPEMPTAEYRIQVSKPNYLVKTLVIKPGQQSDQPILIRLVRCGAISGTVLNAQDQPVRSATVFAVLQPDPKNPVRPLVGAPPGQSSHVNADGSYRLYGLSPGQYVVAVTYGASTANVVKTGESRPGPNGSGVVFYPSQAQPKLFGVSDGESYQNVNFAVSSDALYRVGGQVESSGRFIIALTAIDQPAFATAVTQSAPNGAFHLEGIPPGSYTLFASGPAHIRGSVGFEPENDSEYGHIALNVTGDLDDVIVPVGPALSRFLLLKSSVAASSCTHPIQFTLTAYMDSAMDLRRRITIGFTQPTRVGPLPSGRYFLTADEGDAPCQLVGNGVIDLNSQDIVLVPVSPRKE